MRKVLCRDFTCDGVQFHLNDNSHRNEFEGRYRLLYYAELANQWRFISTVDSMMEARQDAKRFLATAY